MSAPAKPTFVKRNAKLAERATIRRSAASAITAPAPAAMPFTAAMIGSGHSRIPWTTAPVIRVNSSSPSASRERSGPMMSFTSPPEQNARPAPVTMTARTCFASQSSLKKRTSSA